MIENRHGLIVTRGPTGTPSAGRPGAAQEAGLAGAEAPTVGGVVCFVVDDGNVLPARDVAEPAILRVRYLAGPAPWQTAQKKLRRFRVP